jgi:hypothetical protein
MLLEAVRKIGGALRWRALRRQRRLRIWRRQRAALHLLAVFGQPLTLRLRRSVGSGGLRADIPARFSDLQDEVARERAQGAPKRVLSGGRVQR